MKNAINTLAIIPLLIGLGVTTAVSAKDQTLLTSMDKAIEDQSQQVSELITTQLKQSYLADIAVMAKIAAEQWNEEEQIIAKSSARKINNTTNLNK